MKGYFILFLGIVSFTFCFSQQGDGGIPKSFSRNLMPSILVEEMISKPDIDQLRLEDKINDSLKLGPWRFGYNQEVDYNLFNTGTWINTPEGDLVWLLKIYAQDAKTLNLTFTRSFIPEGNELYVYNEDHSIVLGKFTQNHFYKGTLGTELIRGEAVIIEYFVPAINAQTRGELNISRVTYGYRSYEEFLLRAFGGSGSCEINVNCPDGAPYKEQKDAVVMIVSGSNGFCTGALINNTDFDEKPYVLTANHCYNFNGDEASWIFRFNWESPNCDNPPSPPSYQSLSGSVLRARRSASDFCLVEIMGGLDDGKIPESYNPFFAGWDNRDIVPTLAVGIHHPKGDIKKIAFADTPAVREDYPNSSHEPNNSWMVYWDRGTTTESASSGSPLFNSQGRIIGQLWGGNASCLNSGSGGRDYYGRLHNSWEPFGSTSEDQLKYWLDPSHKGDSVISGFYPYQEPKTNDVTLVDLYHQKTITCASSFIPQLVLMNSGEDPLTSLVLSYSYNGVEQMQITWVGYLERFQLDTIILPEFYSIQGNNTLEVDLLLPNGQTDENIEDNSLNLSFQADLNKNIVDFIFLTGCYSNEVSWKLLDENSLILYSGENYPGPANLNYQIQEEFCLSDGCYHLVLMDNGGDGVKGASYPGCNFDGSMQLINRNTAEILAELEEEDANFGNSQQFNFCLQELSTNDEVQPVNVRIYPNPTQGLLNIEMNTVSEKEIVIRNTLGQEILQHSAQESTIELDLSFLAKGVYFIQIQSGNNKFFQKLVLK